MILRRVGIALAVALIALIGLWIAALTLLPGAPRGFARLTRTNAAPADTAIELLAVPVAGVQRGAIRDSWGDPRDNGLRAHHGTDVIAPANTPVLAAAAGKIEKLWTSEAGGTAVYVRAPDRGWTYYHAHLAGYAPGLHEGQIVKPGDLLGFVGDTGNAGAGNFHLHFGLTRTTPQQHWYEGEDVNPYPYLAGTRLPR